MAAFQHADASQFELIEAPESKSPVPRAQAYSVPAQWIRQSSGLRFDAEHFNPDHARAVNLLRGSGMELRALGEVTKRVFIPPRFKRVYVDREHGVPFLQGSHLVHAEPADIKYLSRKAIKNLDRWIIRSGWVLVTCSGTIGRIAVARQQWDQWAASQHILRIVPSGDERVPAGYLAAYLRSFAGQAQLTSHIYGAVVDELTEDQAQAVLVPVAKTKAQQERINRINDQVLKAVVHQEKAVSMADEALDAVVDLVEN